VTYIEIIKGELDLIHIFYHADTDGRCAAAVVNRKFPGQGMFHELDYKDPVPIEYIQSGDSLIIVDFSLKPEVMDQVFERIQDGSVIHLDHHITAMEYKYSRELDGIRKIGEAGCLLAWKFYFPDEPIPTTIKLISDFDVFNLKFPASIPFIEGLRLEDTSPTSNLCKQLLDPREVSIVKKIVDTGKICVKYRKSICEEYAENYGWETEFAGYKAFACGLYKFGSFLFGDRIKKYDLCLSYEYLGENNWQIGVYTTKEGINVGDLCKKMGEKYGTNGGGHKKVGGFGAIGELPFKKNNPKTANSDIIYS